MCYEAMKRNEYYQVKDAQLKRLDTIHAQIYDILEMAKIWRY